MSRSELMFAIAILILLLHGVLEYVMNRVYIRRAKTLESVLGSRLRCKFWGVISDVEIRGTYKGRQIQVTSRPAWNRMTRYALISASLPRHKWFVIHYPRVIEDVYLAHNTFVNEQYGTILGRSSDFDEHRITSILDKLVEAANTLEME